MSAQTLTVLSTNVDQYYLLASSGAIISFTVFMRNERLGMIVLFYYDFALTLPQEIKHIWSSQSWRQEIKHIWSSKLNVVNVLVISLRYITAFSYVPVLLVTFVDGVNKHDKSVSIN